MNKAITDRNTLRGARPAL
jgi:hypothetical protein